MENILKLKCALFTFVIVFFVQILGELIELPDEPVQLLKPDSSHRNLVLVQESIQLLHEIKGSVATVAVVGKYHSGKSFLLNQLMQQSGLGFKVGQTVKPQTKGIWMCGKPMEISMPLTGEKLSVIFLDTEGFAANNISEHYDAKIFAVSTMLSSYLIYSSVKIIDKTDTEYLEILSRRTRLFALRSQMSKPEWTNNFTADLLTFPPLLWVVQDFVQTTDDFLPTEWLRLLLCRETEDFNGTLLRIFNQSDCRTLFLPSANKQMLADLSQATDDDLTDDYKMERDEMTAKLFGNLKPKMINGKAITGANLANFLRILVSAVNDWSLIDVPIRWAAFTQQLKTLSVEDCRKYYNTEFDSFIKQAEGPIAPKAFQEWHNVTLKVALNLLGYLLNGMDEVFNESSAALATLLTQEFEVAFAANEENIKLKCNALQSKLLMLCEEIYDNLHLPVSLSELREFTDSVENDMLILFTQELQHFLSLEVIKATLTSLKITLKNLGNSIKKRNGETMERFFSSAADMAKKKFEELTQVVGKEELQVPETLNEILKTATEKSMELYLQITEKFKEELMTYWLFRSLIKESLCEAGKTILDHNVALVTSKAVKLTAELINDMEKQTENTFMLLPIQNVELESRLKSLTNITLVKFDQGMDEFNAYRKPYMELKSNLTDQIEKLIRRRRKEKVKALAKDVLDDLEAAKGVILQSAEKYTTQFGLNQYMLKVCLSKMNGKASSWPYELRVQVIDHFIQSSSELDEVLRNRNGPWSSVVGFFQWILWWLELLTVMLLNFI